MKAAVFRGAGEVGVTDVPVPELADDEVLIHVAYCGICGSDVEAYQTGMYEPGLIIGHEMSGTIAATGIAAGAWRVGERVTVNDSIACLDCPSCRQGRLDTCESVTMIGVTHDGALAEYVKVQARSVHRLPGAVSLREAALIEPLTIALHGLRRSRLKVGDVALVCGAGPIGLFTLQAARLAGARAVAVTEVDGCRAALARDLGATVVIDPTRENVSLVLSGLTEGQGPDVIYVCTGAPAAFSDAVSLVRKGGQIFALGVCVEPVEMDLMSVVMGDLSIEGCMCGRAEFPAAIDLVAQGRVAVEPLISHQIDLDDVVEGIELAATPGSGAVKVLVSMN